MYEKLAHVLVSGVFDILQPFGVHVLPNHFYNPIPDTRKLPESLWERSELPGIDLRPEAQLALLREFERYSSEFNRFPQNKPDHGFYLRNGYFETVDAESYYSMIRHFKPHKIIEIGAGFSTMVASQAVSKSGFGSIIAIEPDPREELRRGLPNLERLITLPVQQVPIETFSSLIENDILFIDSSHVLKIGSDVQYEILQIIPRLSRGVIVHFHDIFLPFEYPEAWVKKQKRFWNEQYFLEAFLSCNRQFEVLLAANYLATTYPAQLKRTFSSHYAGCSPGSFWIRRCS
jgi:predicted O-methyltransferase YrrM